MISTALFTYLLCALISAASAFLLLRGWRRSRSRMVLWIGVAFAFLTVSNVLLVFDLVNTIDFARIRPVIIAVGLGLLIYGLVWEQDR